MTGGTRAAVFQLLTSDGDERVCKDIPESACREEPKSFFAHLVALTATKLADGLVDPKLVLSWLLTSSGAPAALVGLLVPIREAGALLPQIITAASLRRLPKRKWAWSAGSALQGVAALGMGATAAFAPDAWIGPLVILCLGVLALARSVCSVTYKDVLGKTIAKSRRGTATGAATSLAAAGVLLFGAVLTAPFIPRMSVVITALFAAGVLWLAAAAYFAALDEHAGATDGGANALTEAMANLKLLRDDPQLLRFIATRGLLVSTALAPPFMVAMYVNASGNAAGSSVGGLGLLVIASGLAGLLSSYVWGRLADQSSRQVLAWSAGVATLALLATLVAHFSGVLASVWALPVLLFVLMVAYQGVRLGRATHLVDMAGVNKRAPYAALSNTLIGLLLIAGGLFSVLASVAGETVVIAVFAAMSLLAVGAARSLDEVQEE